MRETLLQVLMRRDKITEAEAEDCIEDARVDLSERLEIGEIPFDICEEWFGLEPDYLDNLISV